MQTGLSDELISPCAALLLKFVWSVGCCCRTASIHRLGSSCLLSLRHEFRVVRLLAAGLCVLDLVVFSLETTVLLLPRHGFFNEILSSFLLVDPGGVELGGSFYDGADLGELRDLRVLGSGLLVVTVGIEDGSHAEELQIAFEGRRHVGERHVEPVFASIDRSVLFI